jgi:PPM family protein phosphatase
MLSHMATHTPSAAARPLVRPAAARYDNQGLPASPGRGGTVVTGFRDIEHSCLTDVGIRRSHNQDALAVLLAGDPQRFQEQGHIFLVADGMGGHAVGEKASAKAVRDIPHLYQKHASEGPAAGLRKAFAEANAGIHAVGQENPEFKGMGTTATALLLRPEGVWVGHVGDSRAYRVRGGQIQQLSFDHSYAWEMARRQGIKPEALEGIKTNVIVRSLGPDALVQVDIEGPHPVQPGDVFLLCSDGLSGPVADTEIGAVAAALPPAEACRFLVDVANLRGGPDNISVLIVRVPPAAPAKSPSGPKYAGMFPVLSHVPWPIYVLTLGLLLTAGAICQTVLHEPGGTLLFALAVLAIGGGLIGLALLSRKVKAEKAKAEANEPAINVYRQLPCKVERALLERWTQAEGILRQRLKEQQVSIDWAAYQAHHDKAEKLRHSGDLLAAFGETCRAMQRLIRGLNENRNKSEVFQPVWDK